MAVNMTRCMNPSTTVTPVKGSSDRTPSAIIQTTTDFGKVLCCESSATENILVQK